MTLASLIDRYKLNIFVTSQCVLHSEKVNIMILVLLILFYVLKTISCLLTTDTFDCNSISRFNSCLTY